MKELKLTWKKNYGDDCETDDLVLWCKGNPLDIVISGATCGDVGYLFLGDKRVYMAGNRRELKDFFNEDEGCQKFLTKELKSYGLVK